MALTEHRYGALYVVQDDSAHHELRRALKQIDPRLFLEKQVTIDNEEVWCVVADVGGDRPPLTILEWRDERGRSIPVLDSGIVERVARMEQDGHRLALQVMEQNQRLINQRRSKSQETWVEMTRDMVPRIYDRKRPVLHRSQALRMSRDRRRAQGENI